MELSRKITVKGRKGGHCQGIAIDKERKYIYLSFTTELLKVDLNGNIIGSCKGLVGHLGCIAMNYEENKVYGSLEFKHDSVGKDILKHLGVEDDIEDGFYIAVFDCDKITRENMDAEKDGVMNAVFLKEVLDDYKYPNHKYGCSGIDGTTFAPLIGKKDGENYLYVSYGIYLDKDGSENDNQVILRYDIKDWDKYLMPLNQKAMHRSGPSKPDSKYFLYTGNTEWGVQNLEYDPYREVIMAAVYKGKKEKFPNYDMFFIDQLKEPITKEINGEQVKALTLKTFDLYDEKSSVSGSYFPLGSTGMISLGGGLYYFSDDFRDEEGNGTDICLFEATEKEPLFQKV